MGGVRILEVWCSEGPKQVRFPECFLVSLYLGIFGTWVGRFASMYLCIFVSLILESAGVPQGIFVSSYLRILGTWVGRFLSMYLRIFVSWYLWDLNWQDSLNVSSYLRIFGTWVICILCTICIHCGICILPIHLCSVPCSIGLGAGRVRTAWAGGEVPRTNRPLAIHIHTMPAAKPRPYFKTWLTHCYYYIPTL